MKILQSRSFRNKVKKLGTKEKQVLDSEVKTIIKNPSTRVEKKGDLLGVLIHKFKIKATLYILSYRVKNENLELTTLGPHENYYRDLKTHLKK